MTRPRVRRRGPDRAVLSVALAGVAVGLDAGAAAVAGPLVLAAPADGRTALRNQVFWILGAAAVGGGLGWGLAAVAAPTVTTIALGFGIAIGGGLGAVARLFVVGQPEPQEPAAVTVGGADETPAPRPADLFEDHPDPVLYFDDAGDGPVVRAVNDAFTDRFGVDTAVENAGLADGLLATERVEDAVAAARDGGSFDAVIPCETGSGTVPFRVRTVTVTTGDRTRGYVLYTPVERS